MSKHLRKRRPLRAVLLLLLFAVLAAAFTLWGNISLQVTRFDPVFTDLPTGFDGCRIVVLSDLHGATFGEENADLFSAIATELKLLALHSLLMLLPPFSLRQVAGFSSRLFSSHLCTSQTTAEVQLFFLSLTAKNMTASSLLMFLT